MPDPEHGSPADIDARFAGLEEASTRLSGDVQALTRTLQIVNDLQKEQREQKARQELQEQELAQSKLLLEQRDQRSRSARRNIALGLSILIPVVSILVYWSLITHVNTLLDETQAASYNSCLTRNESAEASAKRESLLAAYETNAKIAAIHITSAAQLRASKIDCSKFRR